MRSLFILCLLISTTSFAIPAWVDSAKQQVKTIHQSVHSQPEAVISATPIQKKPNALLQLKNAVVKKRHCGQLKLIVQSQHGQLYEVYFQKIGGEAAKSANELWRICHRHRAHYEPGDLIDVYGQYQKLHGRELITHATVAPSQNTNH